MSQGDDGVHGLHAVVFRVRVVVTALSSFTCLVVVTAVPFYATTSWSQF